MNTTKDRKYTFLEHFLFPKTSFNKVKLKSKLNGKTVFITGASFGIGECLALMLAKTGANLILVARTKDKLQAIKERIIKKGGFAEVYALDLRNEKEIEMLISYLKEEKQIDYFINNAGKSIRRPLLESLDRYHDFSRTMAINYNVPVKLTLALLPQLSRSKGHVINISAINVLMAPAPYWAAYQASKSAFDQWFRSFSAEIKNMGVATTSIYLPLVKTRMIAPTKKYENMPTMNPNHVSKIICKYIINRKDVFKPWWSIFGEIGSLLFRKSWSFMCERQVKK